MRPPGGAGTARRVVVALVLLAAGACRGAEAPPAPPPAPPAAPPGPARPPGYDPPRLLATLADQAVTESSGLAASRRNPGILWTHNDSGDSPQLYCFDRAGTSCGRWPVGGAAARDWEDMAAGPGPTGQPSLLIGDIGDNDRVREEVIVYVVAEPEVGRVGQIGRPLAAESVRLTYPDGPHDAEALLVHPASGDLYVVTKELTGRAGVYKATAPLPSGGRAPLVLVAEVTVAGLVTGGDVAPDGRRVALCTYGDAVELTRPGGGAFDEVWRQPPVGVALAPRRQGEAIAYRADGATLLTTSEGVPAPIHEMARRPS